jgi:hypothetical protein
LKARVNDQWIKNGTCGVIDWTKFDEETVECALSYLYIEDYDVRGRTFVGEQTEERNDDDQIGTFHSPPLILFAVNEYTFQHNKPSSLPKRGHRCLTPK